MQRKRRRRVHRCTCPQCRQHPYSGEADQHRAIQRVLVTLDEKNRRRFAGLLALQRGWGGVQTVMEMTGLSRNTICRGRDEIQHPDRQPGVRQAGGGRKRVEKSVRRF